MNITVRQQKRKSLAFKLTSDGAVALVPDTVDPESQQVKDFIAIALAKLPCDQREPSRLQPDAIHQLVKKWQERLGVTVARLQIRTMRNKWGSISTLGTLTLAEDLLSLPYDLVEYVIVHELLHLKFPDHRKGWRVSMGIYLPTWLECEYRLQHYISKEITCP